MRNGLQIVKKTYCGVEIGYVVGWWTRIPRYFSGDRRTFRSVRQGVVFPTEKAARKFRDKIEDMRDAGGVKFERIED